MDGVEAAGVPQGDTQKSGAILKLLVLVAVIAAGFVLAKFTPLGTYLSKEGVLGGIEQLRGSPWAPVIFVSAYAVATALAIPGTVLTLAGGALFGVWFGILLNSLGANIGANLAFLLARGLGRDGITKLFGSRLDKLDKATDQHGFQGLLTLRLIPVAPFNALNFGSGLTSIPWSSYALATVIGILPGTAVYTFFGEALLQGSTEASSQAYTRVFIAGLLLVALSLLPRFLKSRGWIASTGAIVLAMAVTMSPLAAQSSPTGLPDHAPFSDLLADVVSYPRVDYAKLKNERARLDSYLEALAGTDPAVIAGASRDEQLAFWMNAYNACMLRRVVDRYPIKPAGGIFSRFKNRVADRPANSVWQIDGVFTESVCEIAGAERSQDQIEHEVLRPLGEPRIHFAVNCAALSCPPLPTEAFEAARVDEQLDARVRAFVADPHHLRLEEDGGSTVLLLNKVLEWYGEDFGGTDGVRDFLIPYLPPASRDAASSAEVRFMDYDWTLNDIPR
jgi:uncharacterized membrane protein YdjX (TVP38/TMEM64 family)